jgi:hypothetical protein
MLKKRTKGEKGRRRREERWGGECIKRPFVWEIQKGRGIRERREKAMLCL